MFGSAFVNTILSADAAETTQESAAVCRVELIGTFGEIMQQPWRLHTDCLHNGCCLRHSELKIKRKRC